MKGLLYLAAVAAVPSVASATVIVNQQPGTLTARASQLWQDPGPNGNDLDGDAVCFEDFTLSGPASIGHLEWWGSGACELGFRIQVWKQDPGTIAYQPIGVFYYGGNPSVHPDVTFDTTAFTSTPGPNGTTHYVLNLATPINLAANDATNPRWFICVIGLTHQAYYTWDWASGSGGSTQTFQFVRGGTSGGGPLFRRLGEGRALEMEGTVASACYANCDGSTAAPVLNVNDFICFQSRFASGDTYANCDGSTTAPVLNVNDFVCFQTRFAAGCP